MRWTRRNEKARIAVVLSRVGGFSGDGGFGGDPEHVTGHVDEWRFPRLTSGMQPLSGELNKEFRIGVSPLRNTWVILVAAFSLQLEKQALAFGQKVWPGAGELAGCYLLSGYLKLYRLVWCHPRSSKGASHCVFVGGVPPICSLERRL